MSQYVVGAYPASPAHRNWDPELEKSFFNLLSRDKRVSALELPWLGKAHPHDVDWLYNNFPKNLNAVITSIPFVMGQLSKDPTYGLASSSESGREKAIADIRIIFEAIKEFNNRTGREVVSTLEIHSAPRETGNSDSLAKSLETINSWNWEDTKLVIEHCDAFIAGQTPEKGFISLQDEIEAINKSDAKIGILINWGRSAIEFRDADRVLEHLEIAKQSGLLSGLIFSGASDQQGLFGYPWIDAHHPFKKDNQHRFGDPDSLLTPARAKAAIDLVGDIPLLGIKMGWPNEVPGGVEERFEMISSALDELEKQSK